MVAEKSCRRRSNKKTKKQKNQPEHQDACYQCVRFVVLPSSQVEMRKLNPNRYTSGAIAAFVTLVCFQFTLGCEQIKPKREMMTTNSAVSGQKQRLLKGSADSPARGALYNVMESASTFQQ